MKKECKDYITTNIAKAVEPKQSGVLDCIISEFLLLNFIYCTYVCAFFFLLNVSLTKAIATADISCF